MRIVFVLYYSSIMRHFLGLSRLFLLLSFVGVLFSCKKSEPPMPPSPSSGRTVFVYMLPGDQRGDLSDDFRYNINNMEVGFRGKQINGRLICLVDLMNTNTQLIEITSQGRKVLKEYGTNINTASIETFSSVWEEVKALAPAASYGLVLSSHGSGWLPPPSPTRASRSSSVAVPRLEIPNAPFRIRPLPAGDSYESGFTRAFGQDGNRWLSTADLKKAIPSGVFDYILFDACYMASVEFIYELRDKARYFITSSAEIISSGFPYSEVVDYMFPVEADLESSLSNVCKLYFEMYNSQINSVLRSATVSLVKTAALPALAAKIKAQNVALTKGLIAQTQHFNRQAIYPCYDLDHAYSLALPTGVVAGWEKELKAAVVVEHHTEYMLYGMWNWFKINRHCGLTTYIPGAAVASEVARVDAAWEQMEWVKDTN